MLLRLSRCDGFKIGLNFEQMSLFILYEFLHQFARWPIRQVVRRFRRPDVIGTALCGGTSTRKGCGQPLHGHGWIDTLEGGHTVCPGDWIITGVAGERYPCKPDIFEQTYEEVDSLNLP